MSGKLFGGSVIDGQCCLCGDNNNTNVIVVVVAVVIFSYHGLSNQ